MDRLEAGYFKISSLNSSDEPYINSNPHTIRDVSEKIEEKIRQRSVERWLLNLKPASRRTYLPFLKRFCDSIQKTPDQLVENVKSDREAVHDRLKASREKLQKEGLASNTYQSAYIAVRSFLAWNGFKLDKMPRFEIQNRSLYSIK